METLCITDPIYNTGIHLATGDFHTSRLDSLCGMWRASIFPSGEIFPRQLSCEVGNPASTSFAQCSILLYVPQQV
jgi:hypothetical protein